MPKWWWENPAQPTDWDFARGLVWLIDPAPRKEPVVEAPFWYKGKHRRGRKS